MKQIVFAFMVFSVAAGAAVGQSAGTSRGRLSFGGGTTVESYKSGGFAEFGLTLLHDRGWIIRNFISFNGYGTAVPTGGIMMFGEKLTAGGRWSSTFETYAFVSGAFGQFATTTKKFLDRPYLWSISGGGGLQIDLSKGFSYFVELGGGWNSPTNDASSYSGTPFSTGYAAIAMGFRRFF